MLSDINFPQQLAQLALVPAHHFERENEPAVFLHVSGNGLPDVLHLVNLVDDVEALPQPGTHGGNGSSINWNPPSESK